MDTSLTFYLFILIGIIILTGSYSESILLPFRKMNDIEPVSLPKDPYVKFKCVQIVTDYGPQIYYGKDMCKFYNNQSECEEHANWWTRMAVWQKYYQEKERREHYQRFGW